MNSFLPSYHFSIDAVESIDQVRQRFNRDYPDLSLNFYKTPRNQEKCSFNSVIYFPDVKMNEINANFRDGTITVTAGTTIRELEHVLFTQFGISVQVSWVGEETESKPGNVKPAASELISPYFRKNSNSQSRLNEGILQRRHM